MKILVTGSTGLIGASLVQFLTGGGHVVSRLDRARTGLEAFHWNPDAGEIDLSGVEGQDAVVHLAGENIGAGRWTAARKARIRESRVRSTRLLSESLAAAPSLPGVLVCASAIGYYGDRGDETMREESPPGTGFLSELCRDWEAASEPAVRKGIRVVRLRIGLVLSAQGGALARMLFPFRMGLGGKIGSGKQFMSWIALDDLLGIILHAINTESLRGAVNAVAPDPVTNREFTRTLGRVLGRPTLFPLPAFVVRAVFGQMGDELLLSSTRVEPAQLAAAGFSFRFPQLEEAFRHVLGR